ncbi:IucA/IucC family protein [Deinococcus misasensis]|uniref:IucA/IucC family protein n=1 Tax=Deinococcus misasensis TaxID=392413 RepID=UPI000556C05F|nr:IucA/IucC family protein [Deinococcus misasensis]
MAHPAPATGSDLMKEHPQMGQSLLTALLRENVEHLDASRELHPRWGWCARHQQHWIPLQKDGLWHTVQATTSEVWDEEKQKWIPALDFIETLNLPFFAGLQAELQSALEYETYRAKHQKTLLKRSSPKTLLDFDRLASLLNHPIYPLPARTGFSSSDLEAYCPESSSGFLLRWVAVPCDQVTVVGKQPDFFPSFAEVGLKDRTDHVLFPVHPHTLSFLGEHQSIQVAPEPFLKVHPTLSLRTLVIEGHERFHLKVPLMVRTLGQRNVRTLHPDSFQDGHRMQEVLAALLGNDLLLTDESHYAHAGCPELGYLLRTYPEFPANSPEKSVALGLAGLLAPHPEGKTVLEHLSKDPLNLLKNTVQKLLELHLTLALQHGVVLEAHQQNTTLLIQGDQVQILLRDNDSPRILWSFFKARHPVLARHLQPLGDERIETDDPHVLADMFITIILHLCVTSVLQQAAQKNLLDLSEGLRFVRACILEVLQKNRLSPLAEVFEARILNAETYPSKRMLSAGTLYPKDMLGATDINKCYRHDAPNYLKERSAVSDQPSARTSSGI